MSNEISMEEFKSVIRSFGFDPDQFSPEQLQKLWNKCVNGKTLYIKRETLEEMKGNENGKN